MISKWMVLLVGFYGVVSQDVWRLQSGLNGTLQNDHRLSNPSPSSNAGYYHNSTIPQPVYYERSTQQRSYYCSASNPNYDCIYQRVIAEPRQSVYFTRHLYRQVTFEDSRMQFFPKSLIEASPNLELLNVASLQIETIVNKVFQNAPRLKQLYMQDNLISSIKRDTFQGANSLTILVLGRNRINQFDPNALKEMRNLQYLYIDSNRIAFLPFVGNNPYLYILEASHNNIARISDSAFYNNSYLHELNLAFNELRSFNMTQLNDKQELELVDVSSNQLIYLIIPNVIHTLRAYNNSISQIEPNRAGCWVRILELSFNQFDALPDLHQCTNLEKLDLSHNQLEQLNPEQLAAMARLGSLNLSHNHLFEILNPPQTSRLVLGWLDLSHNSLTVWPNNFQFQNATELELSSNKWQCSGLKPVINLRVSDRGVEQCQANSSHYAGICCKEDSSNDDAQNLLELAEFIQDNNFRESLNNERTKKRCFLSSSYQPTVNNQYLSNLRKQAAIAESSKQDVLIEMDSLRNHSVDYDVKLQEANSQTRLTVLKTESLTRNIGHFGDTYGVPREGLVTLERLLSFVSNRNRNNAALLARRVQEKQKDEARLAAQKNELESAKLAQDTYKTDLGSLKMEEKNAKTVRDKLRIANRRSR